MLFRKRGTATTGVCCQVRNSFTPGGPHGLEYWTLRKKQHFVGGLPSKQLCGESQVGPPAEKSYKTFHVNPGGGVSNF